MVHDITVIRKPLYIIRQKDFHTHFSESIVKESDLFRMLLEIRSGIHDPVIFRYPGGPVSNLWVLDGRHNIRTTCCLECIGIEWRCRYDVYTRSRRQDTFSAQHLLDVIGREEILEFDHF